MRQTLTTPTIKPTLAERIELWPIARLKPYERNARMHSESQISQIANSIQQFGFNVPILVDSTDEIVAGHGRLRAAKKLELPEVPVIVLGHLTEAQKRAYVLADNRLAELATWDEELLRLELEALIQSADFDWQLTGFNENDLAELTSEDLTPGLTDEDDIPDLKDNPVSRTGDLWLMGKHRLLVGDATHREDVDRLMNGALADLVVTDPPYNVKYTGYTPEHMEIAGDDMDPAQFREFLESTFRNYRCVVGPKASLYVFHASSTQVIFQHALEAAGFEIRCQIIWAKNTFAWGFGRYKFQHEPIFYAHVAGESDSWFGDKTQPTLWQENKPAANRIHPTAKPIELVERALLNSCTPDALVVDLFGGSGATMIGCHRRNRRAFLMEIDPKYADCIVKRFEAFTGEKAVLDGQGASFEQVAQERLAV